MQKQMVQEWAWHAVVWQATGMWQAGLHAQ